MGNVNKLKWIARPSVDWATVNPISGYGSTDDVRVTVTNSSGYSIESTGFIAFQSGSITRTVNVCRCVCNCSAVTITSKVEEMPLSGMSSGTVIATFKMKLGCSNGLVTAKIDGKPLTIRNSNIVLKNDIGPNTETSAITHNVVIYFDGHECPNLSFKIEQEAISCNCTIALQNVTYSTVLTGGVPQAGLPKNTVVVTYDYNETCPDVSGTITYTAGTQTVIRNISFSNGEGKITSAITANNKEEPRDLILVLTYNNDECVTTSFTQNGFGCNCNSAVESFTASIPREGYTAGSVIGSYEMKDTGGACSDTDLSATLSSASRTYTLVCAGGDVSLQSGDSIPGNTGDDDIPYKLTYKYKNVTCGTLPLVQEGAGCSCRNIIVDNTFEVSIPRAGVTGGTQVGSYIKKNPLCDESNITATLVNGSTTYHLTCSNQKVYLKTGETIPENTGDDGIEFLLTLYYKSTECDSFPVNQPGTGCGCGKIHNVTFVDVPSEGVNASDDFVIGTYTVDNNSCQFSFIEVNNMFTMTGNNNNGKIIVTSSIPENSGYTPIEYTIRTKYGDNTCGENVVSQEGTLKCDCENIGLMVTLRKKTFPNSGTSQWADDGAGQGWVRVATGDTHGCGSLSGISSSDMLKVDGGTRVKVVDHGDYTFSFYVYVLENTTPGDRSGGINLFFKKKGEELYQDCNHVLDIFQTVNYCDCDNFPAITNQFITAKASGASGLSIVRMESDTIPYKCHSIVVSSYSPSWIHPIATKRYTYSSDYVEYARVDVDANPNDGPRSGTVYVERIIDADENGKGGIKCPTPYPVTITQDGNACNCDNSNFDYFGRSSTHKFSLPVNGQTDYQITYKLDCGELTYRFDETKDHSWITNVSIDNDNKVVHMDIAPNTEALRNAVIYFKVTVNGVECSEDAFTFEQDAANCSDCNSVKEYITKNYTYCISYTDFTLAYISDNYAACGTISATTNDPAVISINRVHKDVIKRTDIEVKLEDNDTGADRNISFNVFLVDDEGNIVPDANCIKEIVHCQKYIEENVCACSSVTDVNISNLSQINVGATDTKIADVTLVKRGDDYPTDCLIISATTTHIYDPELKPDGEYKSISINEDGEVYVSVVDSIDTSISHHTRIDINVYDMTSGVPVQCNNLSRSFYVDVIPNTN